MSRSTILSALVALAGVALLADVADARMPPDPRRGQRNCQQALPQARSLVGLHQRTVRARFPVPPHVTVRYCAMCTFDYRPDRLTFGLDERGIVRSAACG